MPVIKARTRGKHLVRHITRLDRENCETLFAYGLSEPDVGGDLFDSGTRREEDAHTASLAEDLLEESIIEKFERLFRHHLHRRRLRRIERVALDDAVGREVARIKRRIDSRRQPDESAPHALA